MNTLPRVLRLLLSTLIATLLVAVPALAQNRLPLTTESETAKAALREARDHLNKAEFAAARDAADRALKQDSSFAMALTIRGIVSETFADGASYIDRARSAAADVTQGERHFIDAIVARRNGDMKTMINAMMALGDLYPKDPDVLFMVGQMHYGMQNTDRAKSTLDTLFQIDPDYAAAYNLLGYLAMARDKFEEAERLFKTYVELRPEAPNPYDSLAEYYLRVGDFDNAVANYRAAYEADPRYIDAWTRAGLVMAMKGDVEQGEAEIRKALVTAQDADSKRAAYDAMANAALLDDDVDRALAVLDEASIWAATAAPEHVSYFKMGEGWVLYEVGRRREAEAVQNDLRAMIEAKTGFRDAFRPYVASRATMAEALLAIEDGNFETAEKKIAEFMAYGAKSGNPVDVQLLHELEGTLAYKQGKYEQALDHFSKAGNEPHVYYRAGKTCKKMGDMTQARAYFEKAANANQPTRSFALIRNRAMEEL